MFHQCRFKNIFGVQDIDTYVTPYNVCIRTLQQRCTVENVNKHLKDSIYRRFSIRRIC